MIPAITEVNFPSYATLHQASVSLQDMGDRVITTQVRIDGDVVPDFSGWELRFKGERFVLPSDSPQASKDNTTRNSVVDLQFQSWVIQELKRYYFFEAASVSAGVAIADKYIAPVKLNVEDFVAMLNQVLQYYFGGKIVADLYLSGTGIYSQEPKIVDINYSYLWDVIGKIFEIYGVRNRIEYNATSDVYTIKINYPAPEISDHDFEYGYQGGLLKFERQVQDESLSNILLGRGGEKNLPYRYFKKADPQNPEWAADPDAIPELANIYFDRLRDINFRWYVRGWMHNPNRDTSGDDAWDPGHVFPTYTISSSSPYYWAYQKGLTDEVFAPVEYVKDDASIEAYGEHWGALDNNDDVYPTIRGLSRAGVGRIDEVVAVSPIVTDDIDAMSKAAALEKSINPLLVSYPRSNNDSPILSENFEIPSGQTGNITYAWVGPTNGTGIHIDTTQSTIVAVDSAGNEHSISGLSAGTYRLKLVISLYVPSGATASGTFGIENIKLTLSAQDADAWKPTFDIWVKDIWNTTREQGETDEAYSERVWGPVLGDRTGNEAKIVFSTGFMAASEDYEFVIASYPVPDTSKSIGGVQSAWRITLRKSDAEFDATGLYIPNATTGGKPVAGDKFFFVGIGMPHLYVVMGEEELNTVKSGDLQDSAAVNPTWVISLDKVRVNTLEAGEYGQTLADRLAAGAKLRVTDPRFSGGDVLILHAQSITYTWNEPTDDNPYIVPDIEVVLSDKVVSRESRQDKIESSVEQIRAQYARLDDVEAVVRKVSEPLFLKKTGESDSSASPTQFSSKVSSKGFRQGGVGGTGWGFYRDNTGELADGEIGEGDTVLEVDRMVVRKEMQVNSLVVNQVEYRGGMEVISAAKIEISKVVETPTRYVCYFDQRKNSVANNFQVGDIAYGQVFSPQNVTVRYYKCKVEAVDVDRVELSKTNKDGSGVPQAGDIIVQYGSYTDAARQYVIVRDVVGGGYERMLSGLNAVDATGAEYYFAGRQSGNGPRWFVGGHGANDDYAEFANGVLTIKANVVFKPGQVIPGLEDYEYLKTALPLDEDATLIQGGLILSKTIALTDANGNILSGINGLPSLSSIAAWYGGPMVDHEALPSAASYAKSLFRFDGSGYLAGGNIHWDSNGYGGIPGITWSRENNQDVITIGGNVRLASVDGDTVTSILQTIQALPTTYVDFLSNQTITGVKTFTNGIKIGGGDPILTWDSVNEAWHLSGNFYADGFVSAGGVSDTGGSAGIDLAAMWASLQNTSAEHTYDSTKIAGAHIPDMAPTYGYLKQADIDPILALIPAQASSTNQLADKAFVNSSIATATATYRGNYNEYSDLGLQPSATHAQIATALASEISGADANDYCFVEIPTSTSAPTQIERTERYKYNGTGWEYEYTLNNSGFTAVQWAAINSNITAGKVSTYDTVAGYFDANGKLGTSHLPALYIGDAQVQTSAQTAQDVGGLGNLTMANAMYLRAYNSAGDTLYNLAGLNASNHVYLGAANSPRTYMRGKTLYFLSGDNGATAALVINTSQNATFYGTVYLQNNKSISWKNKPAEGASEINIGLLNLSSSNVLTLGSGLIATGNNARAYNTYLYGGAIYFYTGDTTTGATRKWYISSAGDFIPNDEYRIGSSSKYVKEAYAKKIYLAADTYIEVDSNGYVHLVTPSGKGFYCDGFVSAGGISSGGGSTGVDLAAVWNSLVENTGEGYGKRIHTAHLPDITITGQNVTGSASYSGTGGASSSLTLTINATAVTDIAVGDSGHANELAITKDGTTSYLTVPYATDANTLAGQGKTYYDTLKAYYSTSASANGIQYPAALLKTDTPDTNFWYVHTTYFNTVGGNAYSQLALSYNKTNPEAYIRQAYDGSVTAWKKLYTPDNLSLATLAGSSSIGNATTPVYYNGTALTVASAYAGGTKVTLNGADKGATTASFYAPASAGTAGQILKAASGGPAWTSAALGASNKPIYLNSSGVLTEGAECVDLTGEQTISGVKTFSASPKLAANKPLQVVDYGGTARGVLEMYASANANIFILGYSAASVGYATQLHGNNVNFYYGTNHTLGMSLTSAGKVNIASPSSADATVNVAGTIWASTGIWSDGYVSAGGVASSSDERLKANVKDFGYSSELLMSLKPREWDWNGKTQMVGHSAGFIAQEVEPHLPYAVTERAYKMLTYDIFHALEVSALKDHETHIRDHDTRIKTLEDENRKKDAKIEDLEKEIKRLRAI